jgi:S-adenosylmethionine-dependent methyltransferase
MIEDVEDYYNRNSQSEVNRLDSVLGRIEFGSTLRLIEKHFPGEGQLFDIACGGGRYSLELARRGYRVTLHDLSRELVESARTAFAQEGLSADSFATGNACHLTSYPDSTYDCALLLGPCYHLIDRAARLQALKELARVLKPGGVAIVAYLNSWGLVRAGLSDFPRFYEDATFLNSMRGEKQFPASAVSGFTECYWSTPPIAFQEIEQAGLHVVNYAGAEGCVGGMEWQMRELAETRPQAYENVTQFAVETSDLPAFRDATDHLHIVVSKL